MITQFRVQNFKALRDVTLDLTPIHVLIGPNDTGKTSILEAMAALCRSVDHKLADAFVGCWNGAELVWHSDPDQTIKLDVAVADQSCRFSYGLACQFSRTGRNVSAHEENLHSPTSNEAMFHYTKLKPWSQVYAAHYVAGTASGHKVSVVQSLQEVHQALRGVHYCRWMPQLLSLPVAPDSSYQYKMERSGFGLARCLDDILGYDRAAFDGLEDRFRRMFPEVVRIMLKPESAYRTPQDNPEQIDMLSRADGKGIHFKLKGGAEVAATQASDGLLLVLAYLAVLHLPEPPRVLLVEEPENGIHPSRLKDILSIVRELVKEQSHTQVILTTHSPYVIDLFKPEEVTLCRKGDDGAVSVHRLSKSKTVAEQIDVFTLGEIWTGEGDDALAEPLESPSDASTEQHREAREDSGK